MTQPNLTHLAVFAAVARNLSFQKAAVETGLSSSAVSHAIRGLEERLGVSLLNRTTRSVAPTEAGARLLERLTPALGEVEDRVTGLKAGADDYLVKPYAFAELIARVEALARRRETGGVQTVLKVGELEMNLIGRTVHREGREIDLQPREFQLLEFLMRHAGQSVTRTMLLEKVWEYHFDPQTNVIDVHISRLRSKIDKGFDKAMLQTVRIGRAHV